MSESLNDTDVWTEITLRIPPELNGYESDIKRVVDAAIFKLRRNAHRGKWTDLAIEPALRGLDSEVDELKIAVANGNTLEIWTEAADVMNMALIVAAIALEQQGV